MRERDTSNSLWHVKHDDRYWKRHGILLELKIAINRMLLEHRMEDLVRHGVPFEKHAYNDIGIKDKASLRAYPKIRGWCMDAVGFVVRQQQSKGNHDHPVSTMAHSG